MNLEARANIAHLFDVYKELLPQAQKQALHLYLIEDLTITEVADILATTRQAAHDAINKGVKKLMTISKNVK